MTLFLIERFRLKFILLPSVLLSDLEKGILNGHEGTALKKVETQARKDIEEFFEKKIFLELFVKVNKDWRDDDAQLKKFGYIH